MATSSENIYTPKIQFLCENCWRVFTDGALKKCSEQYCQKEKPSEGWPPLPYRFGERYQFVEELGRGGMGAVFKAYDILSSRKVAVKVVQKIGSAEDRRGQVEMFENEQSAATMLGNARLRVSKQGNFSNFLKIIAFESQEPQYLVMEYVSWDTIEDYCEKGPIPPLQVSRIGRALLSACMKMHHINIVHRDLKPENVFIKKSKDSSEYTVKIFDLGVWTLDMTDAESIFTHGSGSRIVGTIAYMSPEQMLRELVGCQSDLHSVGSILWQLACGQVPYPAVGSSGMSRLRSRSKLVEVPPEQPEFMPKGLYNVLTKLLERHTTDRYSNAREAVKDLKDFERDCLIQQKAAEEILRKRLENLNSTLCELQSSSEAANSLVTKYNQIQKQFQDNYQLLNVGDFPQLDKQLKIFETDLYLLKNQMEPLKHGDHWKAKLKVTQKELVDIQAELSKYRNNAISPLRIKWKGLALGFGGIAILLIMLLMIV